MPKYVVLNAQDLASKLRYGDLEAATASAKHEVKKRGGGPFYVAHLISAFDAEVTTREVNIGEDSQESG